MSPHPAATQYTSYHSWESIHENDGKSKYGGRDFVGYSQYVPKPQWPRDANVALNFVIHLEEGAEACSLHGDEMNRRNLKSESLHDFGSRAGFWRLHRLFTAAKLPVTVFCAGMALERNPQIAKALMGATKWEISTCGYRSNLDYRKMEDTNFVDHLARSIQIHARLFGEDRSMGIQLSGTPSESSRRIIAQTGFLYDSNSFADDLPYWWFDTANNSGTSKQPHLVIPSSPTECDLNFSSGKDFGEHLKATLKFLIEEGRMGFPKMMTVRLHGRHMGRPGMMSGLMDFIETVKPLSQGWSPDLWVCTRQDLAKHWHEHHFPKGRGRVEGPKRLMSMTKNMITPAPLQTSAEVSITKTVINLSSPTQQEQEQQVSLDDESGTTMERQYHSSTPDSSQKGSIMKSFESSPISLSECQPQNGTATSETSGSSLRKWFYGSSKSTKKTAVDESPELVEKSDVGPDLLSDEMISPNQKEKLNVPMTTQDMTRDVGYRSNDLMPQHDNTTMQQDNNTFVGRKSFIPPTIPTTTPTKAKAAALSRLAAAEPQDNNALFASLSIKTTTTTNNAANMTSSRSPSATAPSSSANTTTRKPISLTRKTRVKKSDMGSNETRAKDRAKALALMENQAAIGGGMATREGSQRRKRWVVD